MIKRVASIILLLMICSLAYNSLTAQEPTKNPPAKTLTTIETEPDLAREPFEDLKSEDTTTTSRPPLVAFALNSYQFLGTLSKDQETWAIILAPDKNFYQVKVDDLLGDQRGKITHIYPDRIEVLEWVTVNAQQEIQHTVVLRLKE